MKTYISEKHSKIAILGFGTVGSGVAEILKNIETSKKTILPSYSELKYILDVRDFPNSDFSNKFIKDFGIIENDPEINVVAETIGGKTFAYDFVKRSLLAGKSVVTSNKELVAEKGAELFEIAKEKNVSFLFEASVGGGIPLIVPLLKLNEADEILSVRGILNGTTNFILSEVFNGCDIKSALEKAQELGYAEKDPSDDVNGNDAVRKISILASLVSGKEVLPEKIPVQGIMQITSSDIKSAKEKNCVIKLIAQAEFKNGNVDFVEVKPVLIPNDDIFYSVNGVFNAVYVNSKFTGETLFYGRGAGKEPTAAAVVADIIAAFNKSYQPYWTN